MKSFRTIPKKQNTSDNNKKTNKSVKLWLKSFLKKNQLKSDSRYVLSKFLVWIPLAGYIYLERHNIK